MEADSRSGPIEIQEQDHCNSAAPTNRDPTLFPYCGTGLDILQDFLDLKSTPVLYCDPTLLINISYMLIS